MKKMNKIDLTQYGYRKGFDWDTRFDLKTEVGNYIVSTVDLGIDMSWSIGKPLYYETMIFDKNGMVDAFDGYQVRYSTQKEARKGHKEAVKMVKEAIKNED